MFEQVNKKLKRRISKAVSIVLSAAMLVTALPAELLGGVANVKASGNTSTIVLNANDVTATGTAGTDGKFTIGSQMSVQTGQNEKIFTVNGVEKSFTTRIKTGSATYRDSRAISFVVGEGKTATVTVCAVSGSSSGDAILGLFKGTSTTPTKKEQLTTGETPTTVFTNVEAGTYYLGSCDVTSDTTITGTVQSVNFYYVEVTEVGGTHSGDDPSDDLVEYTRTYSFLDGSIVPTDTTNGTSAMSSEDGKLTVAPGASSGFNYNGNQHGVQMANGGTVTIEVYGNTTIILGGCQHSNGGTVKLGDAAAVPVTTEKCCNEDGSVIWEESNQIILEYTGTGKQNVVLTFEGTVYCPYIIVSGKEPKPNDVEVTVNIKDDDNLLDGATISLVKSGSDEKVAVANGDKKKLSINATYSAVIEKDEEVVEGLAAQFGDKSTITVTEETKEITITVVSTVLEVTPTITGAELEEGYTLCAVDKNQNAVELTNGTAVTLPKDTEYNLEVKDADGNTLEDWLVYVNNTDSSKFKTGKDATQAISVEIKHVTEVKITPVISGKGMLGDNVLYLTAGEESTEVVSGKEMILKPDTTYALVIKTAAGAAVTSLEATVGGKTEYKTEYVDATVTISVSVPATKTTMYGKQYLDTDTFAKVDNKPVTAEEGKVLPGTNILYKTYVSSGVTYDNQLRFRNGNVLWLPIQDDTTRITYVQASNASQPRYVHIGYKDSGYKVQMLSGESAITIDDITDLIETDDAGKKYLPIVSDADVKLDGIKWIEYNPVNTVTVTGKVDGVKDATQAINTIKFKNLTNSKAEVISAAIDAEGNYSVKLRRVSGETQYAASISVIGYKIDDTDDKDKFFLIGNDPTAENVNFTVVDAPVAKVSGTITGVPDTALKGALGVRLKPLWNNSLDPIELTLTKTESGYSFAEVPLERSKSYGVELTNADDYEVTTSVVVPDAETYTASISAVAKPTVEVKGDFITSDRKDAEVTAITFTNMATPDYTYTFSVTGTSYTANLREAEYVTSVTCKEGYEAFDKVSVQDEAVTNDVYLQGPVDESPVEYKATITVGAGDGKDFAKIADAIKYISRMPEDRERVTIELDANATYREQLVINTPDVTIKGNGSKITWYYGVGYSYYSAKFDPTANTAYYDEAYAVDKYTMKAISQNPGHWGATVNLLAGAKGFAAENLTFENSLNYYVTEEELADGAGANVSPSIAARAEGMDVFAKAAKERACVLYIQADNTTYKDCNFLSEQDTLYTGDATENSYFVNCTIEGNTDYICGDGNAVFDKCVLSMYCYSDQDATDSIIVANKAKANHGYLFSDCEVVRATDTGAKNTSNITLVRAWDKGTAYFLNTKVATANMISAAGYKDMNASAAEATYYEYNTHTPDGTNVTPDYEVKDAEENVVTPGRVKTLGGIMTEAEANAVRMSAFFDGWKPLYYVGTVDVDSVTVDLTVPRAGAKVKTTTETTTPGVTNLSEITWYEGDATEAYTGTTYKANTTFRAEMTVDAAEGYVFFSDAKAVVEGAASVVVTLSEDKKTLTIKATYTTGDEEKLTTTFKLPIGMSGLKKGRYAGGFTVMDDFATYGSAGFTDVTGENNHKTGKLSEMSLDSTKAVEIAGEKYGVWVQGLNNPLGENGKGAAGDEADGKLPIPVSGSALILDALEDGIATLVFDNSGKYVSFIDATDPSNITADAALGLTKSSLWEDKVYTIQVKKGHKYYFYVQGSKLKLCVASVEYDGEDVVDNGPVAPGTEDGDDKPGGTEDGTDDGGDTSFDGDDWKKVAKPVIVKADYTSSDGKDKGGKLTLTVKADVSSKGGTSLDVTVQKDGETASQTKTSKAKQDTHVFEFAVSGPGKYKVTAALKRKGMEDKTTTMIVTVKADGSTSISKGRDGLYVELLDDDTDYVYTGSAIKPAIAVYNGDEQLTEGVDYTVKYSNNVKAAGKNSGKKAPTITVTGKGKYTGKTTQTFTIQRKSLEDDDVIVGGMLDGSLIVAENTRISPIVVYRGVVLKAGDKKDFKLTTGLAKDKPTASNTGSTITLEGVNNYTGTLTLTLDVRKKSDLKKISAVKIDKKAAGYDYNGEEKTAPITEVKAGKETVAAENYVVVYNGNQISAGTQKFTVVGLGLYTGSKTSSFKINPRKTTLKLTNDPITSRTFNSAGVTFTDELTVTDEGLGVDLALGKDYKVSYSGNKKVGTGKYTVTFLGNYKGSAALKNSFSITAADLSAMSETNDPSEKEGLYLKSADKAYGKKAAVIKSAPFVLVDGVALKGSDYKVTYYLDEAMTTEMKGKAKVELGAEDVSKTVWVKIEGKKNYTGTVKTSFDVYNAAGKTDISKAKIKIKDNKKEYTGEAVYPSSIEIKVGKNSPVTLNYNADTDSWTGGDNFDVLVVNNIAKGKATVIVTGTDSNVGSKTATFNVVAHNLKNEKAETFWEDFKDLQSVIVWPGLQSVQ